MSLASRIASVNRLLAAVYEQDTRLSTLLAASGCTPEQITILRARYLEQIVQAFVDAIADRLATYDDGKRKQHVLARRFGLDGEPVATLAELGDELGVSPERVRQIEGAALRRCRFARSRRHLELALCREAKKLVGEARTCPSLPLDAPASAQLCDPSILGCSVPEEISQGPCMAEDDLAQRLSDTVHAVLRITGEDISDGVLAQLLAGATRPIILALVGHYRLRFAHGAFADIESRRLKELVGQVRHAPSGPSQPLLDDLAAISDGQCAGEPSPVELQEMILAIRVRVDELLSPWMFAHILYGSRGPKVDALVARYALEQYGVLHKLGFRRVKELVTEALERPAETLGSEEAQGEEGFFLDEPSPAEMWALIQAIWRRIGYRVSPAMCAHVLYGSKGPKVDALVASYGPKHYGMLGPLGFKRVTELVKEAFRQQSAESTA